MLALSFVYICSQQSVWQILGHPDLSVHFFLNIFSFVHWEVRSTNDNFDPCDIKHVPMNYATTGTYCRSRRVRRCLFCVTYSATVLDFDLHVRL